MQRGNTGDYEVTAAGGEQVRAFVPRSLPPDPPLMLANSRQRLLERATLALGRLDSITLLLPDPNIFLYAYVRREAVLSSQIEGTESSLADLLLFELEEAPGVPFDDVVEVSGYVAALEHGMARLREGFPLSNRLFREMHSILLSRGRGSGRGGYRIECSADCPAPGETIQRRYCSHPDRWPRLKRPGCLQCAVRASHHHAERCPPASEPFFSNRNKGYGEVGESGDR